MAAPRISLVFASFVAAVCVISSARATHQEKGQSFDGPGGKLYYEVIGPSSGETNRPLVLVNGGPGFSHDHLHASSAWETLAQDRQIVFYDQRGTGQSTVTGTQTLSDQIADLEALRAKLGVKQIDLLGHSWGGFLSMAYTIRYPQNVGRLILAASSAPRIGDTIYLFDQSFPDVQARTAAEQAAAIEAGRKQGRLQPQLDEISEKVALLGYIKMLFYSPDKRDLYLAQMKTLPGGSTRGVLEAIHADLEGKKIDLTADLKTMKLPVLVLTGRFDMNVAPLVAWRIHQAIPGSQFTVFEHSGHLSYYEEPERFALVINDFLAP